MIGIRVIKTAVAVVIAIYLAEYFDLNTPFSAGLFAVLGLGATLKGGIKNSMIRIMASLVGLFLAALIFFLFGYHIWVIGIFVLVVFSLLARLKLQDGIVSSTVVMLHLFSLHSVTTLHIMNEVYLLLIGLGLSTLINLTYMPDEQPKLDKIRSNLEELLSRIFKEFSFHLIDNIHHIWDGKELLQAYDTIEQGNQLAERAADNKLYQGNSYWVRYFEMRRQQLDSTQRMLGIIAQVYQTVPHALEIARLFEELSEEVKSEYYGGIVEKHLSELEIDFKKYPLPTTNEEFEVRSALQQLSVELKNYLSIAKRSKKRKKPLESL
ncbi:MAG: aromatic acid exporter family protein [Paenibacillaceae bacterium]